MIMNDQENSPLIHYKAFKRTTNNRMDLLAVIDVLSSIHNDKAKDIENNPWNRPCL